MKKLLILCLSIGLAVALFLNANNTALADGMGESESNNYYITYIEYSVYSEDGNIIKSVKKGKFVVTKNQENQRPKENEVLTPDEENEYRILPIRETKDQKPVTRKPRPIIPIIETHQG